MHGRQLAVVVLAIAAMSAFAPVVLCFASEPQAPASANKVVGTIKSINGSTIVLAPDSGPTADIRVDASTRIVRVEPGQKDLKGAVPLQGNQLQVGDRILVRGTPAADAKSLLASGIIVMKRSDVAAKQQREREEWQRHGTGGLVTATDSSAGTITVSSTTFAGKKSTVIHVTKDTMIRRYAPDSVKFDDAKPATLDQIKAGDQLRARGTRNADGNEFTADEIVAGTFRNIAGTVLSTDASANTINVMDANTKKPVLVKLSADSDMRKLPPELAQRIAMRLKGETAANGAAGAPPAGFRPQGASGVGPAGPAGAGGLPHRNGGPPDFQQILSRVPQVGIGDLQKGDAVMIVSTEGTSSGAVTAITLLSGVEPILAASPKGGEGMVLSPWTLSGASAGEDSN